MLYYPPHPPPQVTELRSRAACRFVYKNNHTHMPCGVVQATVSSMCAHERAGALYNSSSSCSCVLANRSYIPAISK